MSDPSDLFPDKRPDLTSIFKRLELVGADTRITVGLLGIEARRAAGQKNGACILELYDLYAVELLNVGASENDTALDEDIPVMVFRLAVERKWIPYPPVRPLKVIGNLLEGWYTQKRYEFVPRQLLTEMFAGYSVTAGYGVEFKKFLEPRIAHWRAELATKRLTAPAVTVATTPRIEPPPMAAIPPAKPKRKPTRIPTTVNNLAAAIRMEAFIAASPLSQTDFAIQAGTTDRTLRSFRATGKIRGDIFARVAIEMGLTREEFMNSE